MTDTKETTEDRRHKLWLCDWIDDSPDKTAPRGLIDEWAKQHSAVLSRAKSEGALKLDDDGKRYQLTSLGVEFAQAHRRKLDEAHDRRRA